MSKPKTVQQWLDLPKDKCALELAEVLTPKPWKHNNTGLGPEGITLEYPKSYCPKCHKEFADTADKCEDSDLYCPVPDPIKIDWNTAMKWYRPHSKLWTYIQCLENIWRFLSHGDFTFWQEHEAQPKHYLIAAAMAMERSKE